MGPACCWPLQFQVPTNHFSTDICSGGFGISMAAAAGLPSANAAKAASVAIPMSFFMCETPCRELPEHVILIFPGGNHGLRHALDLLVVVSPRAGAQVGADAVARVGVE